jgi:hypothetical protein
MSDRTRASARPPFYGALSRPTSERKTTMETKIDEVTEDDFFDSGDTLILDDDDSEIDGVCNESQPCRGDEPSPTQDLPKDIG